jgi:hypothetical protein
VSPTRREFIKQLGVMLASAVMGSCTPPSGGGPTSTPDFDPMITCYEAVELTLTPPPPDQLTRQADILTATATSSGLNPEATRQALVAIARERLQAAWQQLNELAEETRADFESGEQKRDELAAAHRAALDDLVVRGELTEAVAGQVQAAFEAAAYHVWRANAPITCYEPVLIDYKPVSSDRLVEQARLLAERDDLDPQVVSQAQAAIAKEVAFLNMSPEEVDTLYEQILSAQQSGQPLPDFEDVDLDIAPQDLQAAQFLVKLLLGDIP